MGIRIEYIKSFTSMINNKSDEMNKILRKLTVKEIIFLHEAIAKRWFEILIRRKKKKRETKQDGINNEKQN